MCKSEMLAQSYKTHRNWIIQAAFCTYCASPYSTTPSLQLKTPAPALFKATGIKSIAQCGQGAYSICVIQGGGIRSHGVFITMHAYVFLYHMSIEIYFSFTVARRQGYADVLPGSATIVIPGCAPPVDSKAMLKGSGSCDKVNDIIECFFIR